MSLKEKIFSEEFLEKKINSELLELDVTKKPEGVVFCKFLGVTIIIIGFLTLGYSVFELSNFIDGEANLFLGSIIFGVGIISLGSILFALSTIATILYRILIQNEPSLKKN